MALQSLVLGSALQQLAVSLCKSFRPLGVQCPHIRMVGSEAALQDGFQFSSTFSHPVIRAGVTHCWLIRFGFCATHSKCVSHSVLADLAAGVSHSHFTEGGTGPPGGSQ